MLSLPFETSKILYRGYDENKIRQNVECEIFQEILNEARDSYKEDIIIELQNNIPNDIETNVSHVKEWIEKCSGLKN